MTKDSQKPSEISLAEADQVRKNRLVGFLKEQLGKPYHYGIDSRATGNTIFDCSSLVQEAYRTIGLEIARTSVNQATYFGRIVEANEDYQLGDLLFFRGETGYYNPQYPEGIGHVAIYTGDNRAMHTIAWYEEGVEHGEVIQESVEEALKRRADLVGKKDDLVVVKRVFEGDNYFHEGHTKPLPDITEVAE